MPSIRIHIALMAIIAFVAVTSCSDTDPAAPLFDDGDPDSTVLVDQKPPIAVSDLSITYDRAAATVTVEWSAPHDDAPDESVTSYDLRYTLTDGVPPSSFWVQAVAVSDAPQPSSPGIREKYVFANVLKGRDFWVGVRSMDEEDNRSEPSNVVTVEVPGPTLIVQCIDVFTRQPVPDLSLRVSAGQVFDLTSDAQGQIVLPEIQAGGVSVEIKPTASTLDYHPVSAAVTVGDDKTETFVMVPYQQTRSPLLNGVSVLSFLKTFSFSAKPPYLLQKWRQSPIKVFIPELVNSNGVDYQAQSVAALEHWNARTGATIFQQVDSPPADGITVFFVPDDEISGVAFATVDVDADGHPESGHIDMVDNGADPVIVYRVMLHELGHTIRLEHLQNREFIMFSSQPLPSDISDDEALAVRLHAGLPVSFDLRNYNDDAPPYAR